MEVKDVVTIVISGSALIMSGISLWKSFRQDRKAEELKKPAIDYVLPRFEGAGQHEAAYSVRNRGDAPLRLDAIVASEAWPVILSGRNPRREPVRDFQRPAGAPDVWRVPVGLIIEPGAKIDGTVWVESRYRDESLGAYTTVFTFELSSREHEEADLRLDIRRTARD